VTPTSTRDPPVFMLRQIEGFDPDALLEVVRGGRYEHRLLRGGSFRVIHQRLALGASTLDWGHYSLPVLAEGVFPADGPTLGFVLRAPEPGPINGAPAPAHSVQVYPQGFELRYRTPPEVVWAVPHTAGEELQAAACACLGAPLPQPPRGAWLNLRPADAASAALAATIADALESAALLAGEGITPAHAAYLHERLLTRWLSAIASGLAQGALGTLKPPRARAEQLRLAEEHARAHLHEPFSLRALCEASGASARGLQYRFQDVYGLSPQAFCHALRLNEAHRELRRLGPGDARVADLARRWGFLHPGRFAAEYRALFGERPSETLRRTRGACAAGHSA
jgi:AraC-like DNA-binding protein